MSEDLLHFTAAGARWSATPAVADFVRADWAPHLEDPRDLPGAHEVKHNRVRTVARLDDPALYLKAFRVRRPLDRWLHVLKPSPAAREFHALRALAARGVPCPTPAAFGELRRGRRLLCSALATHTAHGYREVPGPLDAYRDAHDDDARATLLAAIARVTHAVFEAGVDHPDLHLANFLVRDDAPDDVLVLDLHSARLRTRPLSTRARLRCLGKLAHSLGLADPDVEPLAAPELDWLSAACRAHDPQLPADLTARLRAAVRDRERTRLRSRDRRCWVDSTDYATSATGGTRTYRRRTLALPDVRACVDADGLATLHAHPRGRSLLETVSGPDDTTLVRKRYLLPSLRRRLSALWRPLYERAWAAARACEVRHVPAPTHLALVVEGRWLPRRATVLMECLDGTTMIHVLLQETVPTPRARRALARAVGRAVGRLHAMGLTHHDLAVQNLLIRARGDDAWDVWFVDLDEVRPRRLSRREKLRALTQLADLPPAATRTDRARWFAAYLAAGGDDVLAPELAAWGARGLGRRVALGLAHKAARKAKRLRRRGHRRPAPTDLRALHPHE